MALDAIVSRNGGYTITRKQVNATNRSPKDLVLSDNILLTIQLQDLQNAVASKTLYTLLIRGHALNNSLRESVLKDR